jgi:hypothetical protein
VFKGVSDRFNGVTIDSTTEACDDGQFDDLLSSEFLVCFVWLTSVMFDMKRETRFVSDDFEKSFCVVVTCYQTAFYWKFQGIHDKYFSKFRNKISSQIH